MTDTELELEVEVFKKIEPIFIDTIKLYCKLDRYKDKFIEPAYKFIANGFYTLCREEFDRVTGDYFIERAQAKYTDKKRRAKLIPRERWIFRRKNRAAKYFFARVVEEMKTFFNEPETPQSAGVKDRGEQAAPRNGANAAPSASLPITTLQAADELIHHIAQNASPTPQKP